MPLPALREKQKKGQGEETTMTKAELVSAMAEKAGITKSQAKDALEAFVDSVTGSLKGGQEVRLVGFGSFVPVSRAAGVARNPRTGESVNRPASQTARFRIGEGLKNALNS
ncbi:MAG: DNA-binding protein HU-beta [Pseudoalteromonas distincta]